MVPPEPPEPSIVAGSLSAVVINGVSYMVVRMTDDSLRVVSVDGIFPVGDDFDMSADFRFITDDGYTPEPPENVPCIWDNYKTEIPSGYSSIEGHLVFVDYDWSEEDEAATWSCDIISNDVRLTEDSPAIYSGDDSIILEIVST